MTEVSFGEWLRRQRSSKGLTQAQLARQIGCATITLRKIEAEERRPSAGIVDQLIKLFEIPQDEKNNFLKFARGDWTKAPSADSRKSPWQAHKSTRTNLPASVTPLIGRERSLAEIQDYLLRAEIRLVTLIGPPGIGKTRLGIEAARQSLSDFPDGVYFVGLATLDDPKLIAATVRQVLGYVEDPKLTPEQQLIQSLGEKQMLIVLDNCEHLVADAATLVSGLLSACSNLKLLATSRESLHIPGEWLYTVPPLELPEEMSQADINSISRYPALTLFAERARAVRNDFSLTADNIQAVSAICAGLDGLPLAIELIAARVRLMPPQALLERLHDQFVLSAEGVRTASARQKTLNDAIGWSYNLLSTEEQKLFGYLSVFSGGFTLDAAEAMFSQTFTGQSISNLVASLLDKSLLQRASEREAHGETRYTMLVTIQEFARERLLELGETTKTRNHHLTYFCKLAQQARSQLYGSAQLAWLDRLDDEYGNIRAALNWAQASGSIAAGLVIAADLEWFWVWRVHLQELRLVLENLLAHPLPVDEMQALAKGHYAMGFLERVLGNFTVGHAHARESEQLCLLLGVENKENLADAKFLLVSYTDFTGANNRIQVIRQRYEEVLELFQEVGNQWKIAYTIFCMGFDLWRNGDFAGARQEFERSLQLFRDCEDNFGASEPNRLLAHMALDEGKYAEARAKLEEILLFYQQARLDFFIDVPLWMLGVIAVREGDHVRAKAWYTECLLFDQQIGLRTQFAECFIGFASIANADQRFERAAQLLGAGEAEVEARGIPLENIDQIELKRLTALLRKELGNARFEALASQGRAMTMEQAIAFALEKQES